MCAGDPETTKNEIMHFMSFSLPEISKLRKYRVEGGSLISLLDLKIHVWGWIGKLGLLRGIHHEREEATLTVSVRKAGFLYKKHPNVARCIDIDCVRYTLSFL